MELSFYNCPTPQTLDPSLLPTKRLAFLDQKPDWQVIEKTVAANKQYANILVIGQGGNFSSLSGIYGALRYKTTRPLHFLNTIDPDRISELKQKLKPADTLVLALSKSGGNTAQVEMVLQFLDYPLVFVTETKSPLYAMAQKLKAQVFEHPPIGGRWIGLTIVALLPAALAGLDAQALYTGGRELYKNYGKENPAWNAASIFYQLEQQGFGQVFLPFYGAGIASLGAIVLQLCHESFGKNGRGQTYSAFEGPEWQHHTLQRFLGGPKTAAGWFIGTEHNQHQLTTEIPTQLHSVQFRERALFDLNHIPLEKALAFELEGTLESARLKGLPLARQKLLSASEPEVGQFLAFWQLYAVYSALLRQVDPFDQPEVEAGKQISFDKRLQSKGLL